MKCMCHLFIRVLLFFHLFVSVEFSFGGVGVEAQRWPAGPRKWK